MNFENVYEICKENEVLRKFLNDNELLGDYSGICNKCFKGSVYLRQDKSFSKDGLSWRCSNKQCGKKISIRQDSWFAKSHLSLSQIIKLTYYWVYRYPAEIVQHELKLGSDHTTTDWFNFAREVCSEILENDCEKIGGPGKTVEIDESKFGKRKYHRGKRVEGVWVFGGIERESRRSFFRIVEDRSAETLIPIIKEFVLPGTTIISDCWKAYSSLSKEGYTHQTVNHSVEFVNKDSGACTNTIESTWHALKNSLPRSGTQKALYESYFSEYCIRKKYLNSSKDKFLEFLGLIKRVYPVKRREVLRPIQTPLAPTSSLNDSLNDFDV